MPLEDPLYDYLSHTGSRLLECAWRMQWVIEKELGRLNELSIGAGSAEVRLKLKNTSPTGALEGFIWEDIRTGLESLELQAGDHPSFDANDLRSAERATLIGILNSRMALTRMALSRLTEIAMAGRGELVAYRSAASLALATK
jgi:hypothetical protein